MRAGSRLELPVASGHDVAVYCSEGEVQVGGDNGDEPATVSLGTMAVAASAGDGSGSTGNQSLPGESGGSGQVLVVKALSDARIAIVGGEPLQQKRHMWWNFVSSDRKRIAEAASRWEALDHDQFPLAVEEETAQDRIPLPAPFKL
eukprot:4058824-Pleurochrysis_carterae.AAC.1